MTTICKLKYTTRFPKWVLSTPRASTRGNGLFPKPPLPTNQKMTIFTRITKEDKKLSKQSIHLFFDECAADIFSKNTVIGVYRLFEESSIPVKMAATNCFSKPLRVDEAFGAKETIFVVDHTVKIPALIGSFNTISKTKGVYSVYITQTEGKPSLRTVSAEVLDHEFL